MSYRDQLSAALARIQALETDLECKESSELQMLRKVNASLKKEIRRLMALHQQALADVESLRRGASLEGSTQMPSLKELNRGAPALALGEAAGVLCSNCLNHGLSRELRHVSEPPVGRLVACSTCDSLGFKRA